ncbi:MAG: hypothetical protein KDD38_09440 [Bdellovibrionales bacterium]|nr:hypothetical protein [Bdellovibrionales bacterium]
MSGCALFQPKKFSEYKEGTWQGKVLIHDIKKAKRGIVNLKVQAIDGQKLRMDVTSPVGSHIASVLLDGNELQYLNVSSKTLTTTKSNREALRELLKVPIEPQALYNVFFDHPMEDKNWSCETEPNGFLKSCKDLKSGVKIEWVSREGAKRTIDIQHPTASIQMNLYSFESKIDDLNKAFTLKVPSSFKVRKL